MRSWTFSYEVFIAVHVLFRGARGISHRLKNETPNPLCLPPWNLTVVFGMHELDVDGDVSVGCEEFSESLVRAPCVGDVSGYLVRDERVGAEGGEDGRDEALDAIGVDEGRQRGEGRGKDQRFGGW